MVENRNTLVTIYYGTYFVFWDISFKVCNSACIMPSFDKNNHFIHFYSVFCLWNKFLIMNITVLYNFSGYQTRIFHSNSVILIVLCLDLENSLFSTIFTQWFKGKLLR